MKYPLVFREYYCYYIPSGIIKPFGTSQESYPMKVKLLQMIDFYLGNMLLLIHAPLLRLVTHRHSKPKIPETPGRIAVLKMLGGGSLLLAGPDLLAIRRKYPKTRFTLLATRAVAPFGQMLNIFDEILIIDDRSPLLLIKSVMRILINCRFNRPDILIDLEVYSRLTSVFTFWTGARNRLGFYSNLAFLRKGLYTHLLFLNPFSGICNFYDAMIGIMGIDKVTISDLRAHVEKNLPSSVEVINAKLAVFAPFCSDLSKFREWPSGNWTQLIKLFLAKRPDWQVAIIGGADNCSAAENILQGINANNLVINYCGKLSLAASARLINQSELFISIDSAPLHMARLLGKRVISLWGATSPFILLRDHPGLNETRIYAQSICSPCVHILDRMTCNPENTCMMAIDVNTVIKETERLLENPTQCSTVEIKLNHPVNLVA